MIAVIVNAAAVFLGSVIGILLGGKFRDSIREALVKVLGLCTVIIGIQSALKTGDILCLIICSLLGTALGELINIEKGIFRLGDYFKRKVPSAGNEGRFTEGFIAACTLYCIGSMTIVGSLEAGANHNYSIIFAKSALDFVSSIAFGAAMGWGVSCSAAFVLLFQGALTLLAGYIGPWLGAELINEMSAAGGVILLAIAINMLELGNKNIKAANMLPAIFLPALYLPLSELIKNLI